MTTSETSVTPVEASLESTAEPDPDAVPEDPLSSGEDDDAPDDEPEAADP